MFDSAMATASTIDREFERTGKPAGVLHGLPLSLKDNCVIQAFDSTLGLVSLANKPAVKEQESETVKILRSLGAVLFCKTWDARQYIVEGADRIPAGTYRRR